MKKNLKLIEFLGFDRAISVNSESEKLSESQSIVIELLKKQNFNIDSVYFNTDENGNSFPAVFLKKVDSFDYETLNSIAETQKKVWNYKKVLFLYVYSNTEIRIYNCSERPIIKSKENIDFEDELQNIEITSCKFTDEQKLNELNNIFSRIAIDSGIIWTLKEAKLIREKINQKRRVDKYLVDSLINTARQLKDQDLEIEFIHKIILRSLFLLYLEDRKATDKKLYSEIRKGAESYFDILDDVEDTYKLFKRLEDYFNGNVFVLEENEKISTDQLQLIKKCFISGNTNTSQINLFENWKLFDFSIIQIELISEIYEKFLFSTDPELKKNSGAFYTPPSLVEFILNEKLPIDKSNKSYNVKILDPSCGSGIFLVESFNRLVKRYENKHGKLNDFKILKKLLTDNIFGIEINNQAVKVAAFSLYLALVDKLDPKDFWQNKDHHLPYLINDLNDKSIKQQGNNLFCRDTIEQNVEIEKIKFNLVVGNPPFGTKNLPPTISNYCKENSFAPEMVFPFLHKATKLSPKGEIALIFNTKVLTNTGGRYQNFRRWLFNECYVEKLYNFSILRKIPKNFGGQLFGDATGPISIVFYQKEQPKNPSDRIVYYAPKTYVKTNVIDGLCIDFSDINYLPREECQKPDTKIWKIAMWGGMNDWELIKRLTKIYPTIKSFFINENISYGVGFEQSNPKNIINNEIKKLPIHTPRNILRYYTPKSNNRIDSDKFRRLGKIEAYQNPHILLNEGIKLYNEKLTLLASFVDYKSAYTKGIVGIYSRNNDLDLLKILTIYLNSDFMRYYAFLITSSWGIERDVLKHKELFEAPYLLDNLDDSQRKIIVDIFEKKLFDKNFLHIDDTIQSELNDYILSWLSESDRFSIQNLLNNIDLFHKQEESNAVKPVLNDQPKEYAELMVNKLNDFLDSDDLFANATIYTVNPSSPLMMIKITFDKNRKEITSSNESIDKELKKIDKYLWDKKAQNIYFRKKLNYKTGKDIYIIRPNQRRFWSKSMALEDASELILEILIGN